MISRASSPFDGILIDAKQRANPCHVFRVSVIEEVARRAAGLDVYPDIKVDLRARFTYPALSDVDERFVLLAAFGEKGPCQGFVEIGKSRCVRVVDEDQNVWDRAVRISRPRTGSPPWRRGGQCG